MTCVSRYVASWSGWLEEVTRTAGRLAGVGDGADAAVTVMDPGIAEVRILVPLPSFASTWPFFTMISALPGATARKVTVSTLPPRPVKPGFGTTPSNCTVPESFENDGSCTHKLTIDPAFEMEITWRRSAGDESVPESALSALSRLLTVMGTEIVLPTVTVRAFGIDDRLAANTSDGARRKI